MESLDITSNGLRDHGCTLNKEGITVVFQNGNAYPKRFSIYKNDWNRTINKIEKTLADDGIPQIIISAVLKDLSDNYDKLMMNAGETTTQNHHSDSSETDTPPEKLSLNDITFEKWQGELLTKHQKLQDAIKQSAMPLTNLWTPLEFALSIKSILHILDVVEPFAGILLAPPSSLKTVTIDLFRKYWRGYFTHNFTPKSFVSHNTSLSEEVLTDKVDMLRKMKDRFFLTPELAPTFNAKEDDLRQNFATLSAVLDGKGLLTNSGGFGRRGYEGEYNFMWLGAVVDIPRHVYNVMGNLGPKVHFLRLPWTDRTKDELVEQTKTGRFQSDHAIIQAALYDYLKWFEACPIMQDKNGLPKMEWDKSRDEDKAIGYIADLARLLAHMRGVVTTWDTHGTQGSDYAYIM